MARIEAKSYDPITRMDTHLGQRLSGKVGKEADGIPSRSVNIGAKMQVVPRWLTPNHQPSLVVARKLEHKLVRILRKCLNKSQAGEGPVQIEREMLKCEVV